ncbi:hypothetical protein [Paraburkholderia elongata]|uniref:Uncharacterized protein n=1 Tax=Paraburkholderia elongata TaxID=2675747 RepID=A0A972NM14_9BURK|nr:hypothetical protein [Paraburkholderia elongata]NPT54020.1 hypothetical protein [Paraburkholderia elongata]
MMFTIYPKVGSVQRDTERRQSIFLTGNATGLCTRFWQDSASALRRRRTVCVELQEYSLCAVSGVAARQTRIPTGRPTGCVEERP